jgi:hypothetical protein
MPSVDQAFEVLGKLSAEELEREIGAAEERLRVLRSMHRRALVREHEEQRRGGRPPASDTAGSQQPVHHTQAAG